MGKKFAKKSGKKGAAKGKKGAKKTAEQNELMKTLDLGMLSASSKLIRKAKTHKGRKFLESKAPQIVEGKKTCIFVKGQKASATV